MLIMNRTMGDTNRWAPDIAVDLNREQFRILDTIISNSLQKGFAEQVNESPMSEEFKNPVWIKEIADEQGNKGPLVLTGKDVSRLCLEYDADVLITLDTLYIDLQNRVEPYPFSAMVSEKYYEISNRLVWSIYHPEVPGIFDSYLSIDTLYYQVISGGYFVGETSGLEMLRDISVLSGYKYGQYLVPVWNNTARVLYRGKNDALKKAGNLTNTGEWESARVIWDSLTTLPDSTLSSKALHNLAVYYELEDKLDSANNYLDRALQLDSLEATIQYKEEIEIRILNRDDIMKQIR